ncbi:restriction endonuclease subunit S [Corynebacterium sp. TAE3-ERU30]|uniref:restriction endonuclease subunit S n=1 Tax=Corynebacterium sp. TAE3-ERU30 TaxID=2849496 RepID=UPI001C46A47E|nr:restriction endonuclease subunit S [Corynebacterium sp. TAE3-ERU30]MBV7282836.1 restriction endonuclease subunit S [Corynebacterium sp. TAE3-ERU30]
MSHIDDLIQGLCPNGVPYLRIGDVAHVGTGSSDRKDQASDGKYPFFVRSAQPLRHNQYEFDETAIIIPGEGSIGSIFHYIEGKYALHQRAYRISFKEDQQVKIYPKFAYYWFQKKFKSHISRRWVAATVTSIRKPMIVEFRIPTPPLEIQRVIADILDKFVILEKELEKELIARRTQLDLFRDMLLSPWFCSERATTQLDNIVTLKAGKSIKSALISNESSEEFKTPCYGGNGIRGYVSLQPTSESLPLIGRQGALCGVVNWAEGPFYATEHAVTVTPKRDVVTRWIYHLLISMNLNQYATKSAQPGLAVKNLNRLRIDLPPLEKQKRDATVLDELDRLVNDTCAGIPAEIAARRKQYEYYRDKLLTFKELEV